MRAHYVKAQSMERDQGLFDSCWKMKRYRSALRVYNRMGRPFWCSGLVGRYYERSGQLRKAVKEYERLVTEYRRIKILPLPKGPVELFKLGRWYTERSPAKARRYLNDYLRAGVEVTGGTNYLRHKKQAETILRRISRGSDGTKKEQEKIYA